MFLRSGPCMDPIILQWYTVFWHQLSLTCGRRQSHNAPFCLACQVHASSFYVIPYGFQMLRIFPKKLDEPCDLVNSDWLNVVLNSFRILMCRCFLHSDHREELRDYPMPRDYGSGHLLSLFGKLHSSVRLMDQVSPVGKVPYHAGHGRRFDVQHIGKVDRARVSLIMAQPVDCFEVIFQARGLLFQMNHLPNSGSVWSRIFGKKLGKLGPPKQFEYISKIRPGKPC